MSNPLNKIPTIVWSVIPSLTAIFVTQLVDRHIDPHGKVSWGKQVVLQAAGIVSALILWLFSYTVILWFKNLKRNRIKEAKANGRFICTCTETGEITTKKQISNNKYTDIGIELRPIVYECPICKELYPVHDPSVPVLETPKL